VEVIEDPTFHYALLFFRRENGRNDKANRQIKTEDTGKEPRDSSRVTTGRRDTSQPSSVVKRKNRLLILAESD
jgi:hypothetical protein